MILALRSFDGGVQIFVRTPAYDELILCLLMIYTYMVLRRIFITGGIANEKSLYPV